MWPIQLAFLRFTVSYVISNCLYKLMITPSVVQPVPSYLLRPTTNLPITGVDENILSSRTENNLKQLASPLQT
jgi:hypothetical protein